jgi:uncharacterized protein (TIGR02246 family)
MTRESDQIESMFGRFAAAWKTNDGAAVGGFFVEDGTLINPFGQRAIGRAAVGEMYRDYFDTMLRGTSTTVDLTSVRAVGDDHVLTDAEQAIHAPDGSVVLAVHVTSLLRRDADGWRFVDSRPYAYAAAPG